MIAVPEPLEDTGIVFLLFARKCFRIEFPREKRSDNLESKLCHHEGHGIDEDVEQIRRPFFLNQRNGQQVSFNQIWIPIYQYIQTEYFFQLRKATLSLSLTLSPSVRRPCIDKNRENRQNSSKFFQIQKNSFKFKKIQENSQLFATIGRVKEEITTS